jgi:hypothetical protein
MTHGGLRRGARPSHPGPGAGEVLIAVGHARTAGPAARGATIDHFRHCDAVQVAFQNEFLVHLRAGEPSA